MSNYPNFPQGYNPSADYYRQQMNYIAQPPMPIQQQIPQQMQQPMQQMQYNPMYQAQSQMQPQQQVQTQSGMITRAVTSVDEAKAAMIDPVSINLFTDFAHGNIYVKKINNNGLAEFYTFRVEEQNQVDPLAGVYERLERIENYIRGDNNVPNAEPIANDGKSNGAAKSPSVSKSTGNATGEKSE